MNESKIVFTMPDGSEYTMHMRLSDPRELHDLATAIRDHTLKGIVVETSTALQERVTYRLQPKAE